MSDTVKAIDYWECYCGAQIRKVADDYTEVWIDSGDPAVANLCYPDSAGADGEATHEPFERWNNE